MTAVKNDDLGQKAGRNLRRAMERSGVRAADLVRDFKVSHQTVGNWKQRGVSSRWADVVGQRVGVAPELISPAYGEREPLGDDYESVDGSPVEETAAQHTVAPAPLPPCPPPSGPAAQAVLARVYRALERAQLDDDDALILELLVRHLDRAHGA